MDKLNRKAMFLSILCPTREHLGMAEAMFQSAMRDEPNDIECLFYVADNDPMLSEYLDSPIGGMITVGPHIQTSAAWNLLYGKSRGDLIMLVGDDVIFETPGWLNILRERATKYIGSPHVFHFLDSRSPGNVPHPIVTRAWAELLGWFVPPWFNHWYVDTFIYEVSTKTGVFTKIDEVLLIHNKVKRGGSNRFPWAKRWNYEDVQAWGQSGRRIQKAIKKVSRWKAEHDPQKL